MSHFITVCIRLSLVFIKLTSILDIAIPKTRTSTNRHHASETILVDSYAGETLGLELGLGLGLVFVCQIQLGHFMIWNSSYN